jgi:hypothetical protein
MKTTLKAILNTVLAPDGQAVLQGGLNRLAMQPMNPKLSYRIGRLAEYARKTAEEFAKYRTELFKTYGEFVKDAEGNDTNDMVFKPENTETVTKLVDEYFAQEKDIWFEPMKLSELGNVMLSGNDMIVLAPFLIDDVNEQPEEEATEAPKIRATM